MSSLPSSSIHLSLLTSHTLVCTRRWRRLCPVIDKEPDCDHREEDDRRGKAKPRGRHNPLTLHSLISSSFCHPDPPAGRRGTSPTRNGTLYKSTATHSVRGLIRAKAGRNCSSGSNYSERVSIRSANPKSRSVNPPLLWVERIKRTLL